jgi:hypothetical protein
VPRLLAPPQRYAGCFLDEDVTAVAQGGGVIYRVVVEAAA